MGVLTKGCLVGGVVSSERGAVAAEVELLARSALRAVDWQTRVATARVFVMLGVVVVVSKEC